MMSSAAVSAAAPLRPAGTVWPRKVEAPVSCLLAVCTMGRRRKSGVVVPVTEVSKSQPVKIRASPVMSSRP